MAQAPPLLPNDDNLRGGHFQAHQSEFPVKIELNLEIRSVYEQTFQLRALDGLWPVRLHLDAAWCGVLWNQDREALLSSGLPVINARKNCILVVKVVVQNGDPRRREFEILLDRLLPTG